MASDEEEVIYEDVDHPYDETTNLSDRRPLLLCFPKKTENEIAAELHEVKETQYECIR